MTPVGVLLDGLALLFDVPGLLLLASALIGTQQTIDLIVGKGDNEPGTNPTPLQDRIWVGLVGVVLILLGLLLYRLRH